MGVRMQMQILNRSKFLAFEDSLRSAARSFNLMIRAISYTTWNMDGEK